MAVKSAGDQAVDRSRAILAKGHPIKFDCQPERKRAPARGCHWHRDMIELKNRVKGSRVLTAIFSMLVSGHLPNGTNWDHGDGEPPRLPLCPGSRSSKILKMPAIPKKYIMCCGHALSIKRAQFLVTAGLLDEGPIDRYNRPSLVITDAGQEWLRLNWREVDC